MEAAFNVFSGILYEKDRYKETLEDIRRELENWHLLGDNTELYYKLQTIDDLIKETLDGDR